MSKAHNCHEKGERGEERDCGDDDDGDDDVAVGMKSLRRRSSPNHVLR